MEPPILLTPVWGGNQAIIRVCNGSDQCVAICVIVKCTFKFAEILRDAFRRIIGRFLLGTEMTQRIVAKNVPRDKWESIRDVEHHLKHFGPFRECYISSPTIPPMESGLTHTHTNDLGNFAHYSSSFYKRHIGVQRTQNVHEEKELDNTGL